MRSSKEGKEKSIKEAEATWVGRERGASRKYRRGPDYRGTSCGLNDHSSWLLIGRKGGKGGGKKGKKCCRSTSLGVEKRARGTTADKRGLVLGGPKKNEKGNRIRRTRTVGEGR